MDFVRDSSNLRFDRVLVGSVLQAAVLTISLVWSDAIGAITGSVFGESESVLALVTRAVVVTLILSVFVAAGAIVARRREKAFGLAALASVKPAPARRPPASRGERRRASAT